ncbi:isochorismatase family protein [Qipengyuania sp. DGS5-3]|uniref:isochorismatase family protein n=1 Tax=Qipengyuania sp. DGS5-3 TaxID=3349632 RepID=UPI0036D41DB3
MAHVALCGCLSNTCIESTARSAIELGYRVTIVSDALAAMSVTDHDAAIETGFPMCAHSVISTDEWIAEPGQ